jgi:hypothetical protein
MNNPHVRGVAASLPPEGAQIALGAARREI